MKATVTDHPSSLPVTADTSAHWATAAFLAALFIGSWLVFDDLPDRIPRHFGLDGTPDGWSDRTPGAWFTLPFVALASTVLMYGSAWLVGRFPDSMNVPDAKRYRQLSPSSKGLVVATVQRALLWIGFLLVVLLLALQAGTFEVSVGRADRLPWWSVAMIPVTVVASSIGAVVLIARVSSLVRRLAQAEDAARPPASANP